MTPRPSLSQAIEPFLRQMAADGRTASSIRSYQRELLPLDQAVGDAPQEAGASHDIAKAINKML
jgi:hypothetical protein